MDLEAVTLVFDVDVRNPLESAVPIAGFSYSLASGGSDVLGGAVELEQTLEPGTSSVELPLRVTFRSLLEVLPKIRPGQSIPYAAELGLALDLPLVGRQSLPLAAEGYLPIPRGPEHRRRVDSLGGLRLDRITGVAEISLTNPNTFDLDITALEYELSLGGRRVADSRVEDPSPLGAGGAGRLDVPLSFSPLGLGGTFIGLLKGERIGYRLHGDLRGRHALRRAKGPVRTSRRHAAALTRRLAGDRSARGMAPRGYARAHRGGP